MESVSADSRDDCSLGMTVIHRSTLQNVVTKINKYKTVTDNVRLSRTKVKNYPDWVYRGIVSWGIYSVLLAKISLR